MSILCSSRLFLKRPYLSHILSTKILNPVNSSVKLKTATAQPIHDVNTNVIKDSLKDAPVEKSTINNDTPWYGRLNLGENKYKNTMSAIAIVIGSGTLIAVWMYTLKSVRYLILNKGGRYVTFVTYTPFGKNRIMKVPVENICCKENRRTATSQLALKVKNTWMHYLLDMRGDFKNTLLFDSTAGLKRIW